MFELLEVVKLKKVILGLDVNLENTGTVVYVPAKGHYIVEFFDKNHDTIESSLDYDFTDKDLIKHN